jgi:Uma2 family endonuclease
MSTTTKPITADELIAMGDIGRCELLYGELVMMSPAGAEHGAVVGRFHRFVADFVDDNRLGIVFGAETGFELAPDLVRAPDVSFVSMSRLPAGGIPEGFFKGAPDLAIEVISPGDRKRDVADKINTWLAHGTRVVWEGDPKTMSVRVHRVGTKPQGVDLNGLLGDEPLLPGFALPLVKVFRLP